MNIAHLADIHLGHRQYGLKQREDDMSNSFRATLQLILKQDPDAILLPGDLFHSRDLRPKILEEAERGLELVPDEVPVVVSRGNHDENLTPREVTWLNYLHRREHIVLLEADLDATPEAAEFTPYGDQSETGSAGFYDIETESGTARVFGLQWRGARTDAALEKVAGGIESTNEEYGEPDYTILLGHFGLEDEVPSLGGNITHAELRDVREVVDYLALGHIHKRYDSGGWIYNPGSPEAHSTREARDDWDHGYYSIELDTAGDGYDGPGALEHSVEHHHARRRPYFSPPAFDVTPYDSFGELREAFHDHIDAQRGSLEAELHEEEFTKGGDLREPMVDLQFEGTLQFDRGDLTIEELAEWTEEAYDALYVQTNTSRITSAEIEELLSEIDDDEVFVDGRLRTEALEKRVFETIASESQYSDYAEEVASLLGDAHRMAKSGEAAEDIADIVTERRRELFPDATESVSIDVPEDPLASDDQREPAESASGETLDERSSTEESTSESGEVPSTDGGDRQ
ncbi:metallophosphoesterase family protein [Halobellus limi]|uniref:DNA repair exonuclease SbcCD nuclease subunit n=1 Tax=Halobellus limi TaxID=699433 RepID=A0A1H6AR14_9EURY|nr:metallophosphoesterase [Halobellus limi]QCC47673.1 metallophosphoesterase [Halobellus limi]SEG50226.1 DNA repair exonuclease SbcCD nuclease subunit [Halobellus limi]